MANRHLSRSIVLQSLFEWDFLKGSKDIREILKKNANEFAPGNNDWDFIVNLACKVINNLNIIDEIISKAAPEWPLDKISGVDRNILRIGLAELLYGDYQEAPPKVVINEAIELAKSFGSDSSRKFVNGVLGTVYRELGEPGKEEEVDESKLPVQKLAGAVVYCKKDNQIYLALVHDIFGYWTLSKGKIEENENPEEGAKREIKEEINLNIEIKEKLGENTYITSHPEKGKFKKNVVYFLAEAKNFDDLKLKPSTGLDDARWFLPEEISELRIYNDILPLITKALEILLEK